MWRPNGYDMCSFLPAGNVSRIPQQVAMDFRKTACGVNLDAVDALAAGTSTISISLLSIASSFVASLVPNLEYGIVSSRNPIDEQHHALKVNRRQKDFNFSLK